MACFFGSAQAWSGVSLHSARCFSLADRHREGIPRLRTAGSPLLSRKYTKSTGFSAGKCQSQFITCNRGCMCLLPPLRLYIQSTRQRQLSADGNQVTRRRVPGVPAAHHQGVTYTLPTLPTPACSSHYWLLKTLIDSTGAVPAYQNGVSTSRNPSLRLHGLRTHLTVFTCLP